jgi:hypothetical protein
VFPYPKLPPGTGPTPFRNVKTARFPKGFEAPLTIPSSFDVIFPETPVLCLCVLAGAFLMGEEK